MRCKRCKYIFIIILLFLYMTFLTLDILGRNLALSTRIKFTVVVLCFLYVIIRPYRGYNKEHIFLSYALLFTVISDILILLTDYYLFGVCTFIIAQQLHGLRIDALYERERNGTIKLLRNPLSRLLYQLAIGALIGVILLLSKVSIDALLAVSIFYFICICSNVLRSLRLYSHYHDKRDVRYFTYGIVLFILCDVNVGLFNISGYLTLGSVYDTIYNISSILMWAFYAPSQVLIALSDESY